MRSTDTTRRGHYHYYHNSLCLLRRMEEVSTHILHGEFGAGETPLPTATERMHTAEHMDTATAMIQQSPRPNASITARVPQGHHS